MALAAVTGVHRDHGGGDVAVVLAAGAVAMFTLDVGLGLQGRIHGCPVAGLQDFREGPSDRFGHGGETAVVDAFNMAAESVALDAIGIVMAALETVNGFREHGGVSGSHVFHRAFLVTEGALRVLGRSTAHGADTDIECAGDLCREDE